MDAKNICADARLYPKYGFRHEMIRVGTNQRIKTMFNGKKGRNGLNNEMVNKYHSNISAKCLVV
ncbi:hypothetical protein Hanom_Chr00s111943g01808051 [Helianthus anomalus]